MSDKTKIEWSDATWNPVTGCTKVSEGCRNCYAQTFAERWRGTPGHYFENGFDITLRPDKLGQPLSWKRPRKIFVNSMSDLFHPDVPDQFIVDVFSVMAEASHHTFQILTKRPERMEGFLTDPYMANNVWIGTSRGLDDRSPPWPLPNVWLGVSVENQKAADERIPLLLQTPAAIRFLSCEPLLGPVSLTHIWAVCPDCNSWEVRYPRGDTPYCDDCGAEFTMHAVGIDWVIVGGESGHNARQMHPEWARSLRDQCQTAGVPFFFKQWGEWGDFSENRHPGHCADYIFKPDGEVLGAGHSRYGGGVEAGWREHGGAWMSKVGKSKAGRLLDGRTWDEFPGVRQ